MPRIDDLFASLSNCKVFCVLDLTGAYQQLKVSDASREYLTINTFKGLFRYKTLCFGVSSAPAIFQSVMDQILNGIEKVAVYLDDIIIGGNTIDETKDKLKRVLEKLNTYNVRINVKKCKFYEEDVNYLGHTLTADGVKPSPEKVKAIQEAPMPTNLTKLQAYLGLLNYYSRFIPNLSSELRELYKLMRKGEKFEWSNKCQVSFENSKKLLKKHSLLELYDPEKPIVVAADASPYGVGAILSHVIDGQEKPVLYTSATLSPAEKNYSQLHREALAIMMAVKRFHKYIYGKTICIGF